MKRASIVGIILDAMGCISLVVDVIGLHKLRVIRETARNVVHSWQAERFIGYAEDKLNILQHQYDLWHNILIFSLVFGAVVFFSAAAIGFIAIMIDRWKRSTLLSEEEFIATVANQSLSNGICETNFLIDLGNGKTKCYTVYDRRVCRDVRRQDVVILQCIVIRQEDNRKIKDLSVVAVETDDGIFELE